MNKRKIENENKPCRTFKITSIIPTKLYDTIAAVSPNQYSRSFYENLLKTATSYEDWVEAATILDELDGLDKWKREMKTADYDWELIKNRLDQLREIRSLNKGQSAMIFALRTSITRNLGDMGNPKLYQYSRIGTKDLTTEYIEEVVRQLNWLCDEPSEELTLKAKHDFIMNMRQSFGRTALLLSGGGTLGLNHVGVIKTLHENQLLPRIISGASSGSIMASLVCTKTSDELSTIFDPTLVRLDVFERDGQPDTPLNRIHRLFATGQLYDVEILKEAMRANIGDITFQEAFNRTRFILNITVSSSTLYDMPRLLNYLTAPDVLIWSAVAASCAVPVIYGSSPLYSKDKNGKIIPWNPNDQLYIDGSVENDLPMNKLSELFNVNHFIVCQVNPHVIPFLQKANTPPSKLRQAANFCMHLAKTEVQHRCTQLTELGIIPSVFNKIQSVMTQKYSGDITIIPEIGYSDFLRVLSNPTQEYVSDCIHRGQSATWPKMSIIKNHLQIEIAIDQILYRLRLLRLNELQQHKMISNNNRPTLETVKSASQIHIIKHTTTPSRIDDDNQKRTEMTEQEIVVQSTTSTPMFVTLSTDFSLTKKERSKTKRNLLMSKPEKL